MQAARINAKRPRVNHSALPTALRACVPAGAEALKLLCGAPEFEVTAISFTGSFRDAVGGHGASRVVARASRPCESCNRRTGETPVPLPSENQTPESNAKHIRKRETCGP